jgi:hypothetical protein
MTVDAELADVVTALGEDEKRALLAIARRLALGRVAYGALDIHGDPRSWAAEARDEALDLAVYLACHLLRARPDSKPESTADHVSAEVDRAVG